MIIRKQWFTPGIIALASIGLLAPAAVLAQHGPGGQHGPASAQHQGQGRHMPGAQQTGAYDTNTEGAFKGTVEEVRTGAHTMGSARMAALERQLTLKTDTGTVEVRLGPPTFLNEKNVAIAKGDTAWALRDTSGQPLWSTTPHDQHK